MLKRVYIDNYKCFVNFTFEPQAKQLILGGNGSGKSAFLEVLRKIRVLAFQGQRCESVFPRLTRTRWHQRARQRFELTVALGTDLFEYRITIDDGGDPPTPVVAEEVLACNGEPLVSFQEGEVELFGDQDDKDRVRYPFDWQRSVLASISPRSGYQRVSSFLGWLARLYCLHLNPWNMPAVSETEDRFLNDDGSNFPSWYRYLYQERSPRQMNDLQRRLADVIDGFDSLQLPDIGRNSRLLEAAFTSPVTSKADSPPQPGYSFFEMSDGQRVLIVLYTLVEFVLGNGTTVCVDEPDNFVALPEIQPWLFALSDRIDDERGQAILISHHPELLNYLARDHGTQFVRDGSGPVRVEPYAPAAGTTLTPSELIARGWDRE